MTEMPDLPLFSPAFAEHLQRIPPDHLHHYTGQDSIMGIIGSSSLWASEIGYLNDANEFDGPLIMLRDRLIRELESDQSEANERTLRAQDVLARVTNYLVIRNRGLGSSMCVACFCEDDDLLSQWRGYAARGYGFSLAFHTSLLIDRGGKSGFILGKCIYETSLQETIVEDALNYVLDPSPEYITSKRWHVMQYITFFKHPSFVQEEEWKLVSIAPISPPETQFRRGNSMIIPYTSIPIGTGRDSAIHRVRVGPCPNMELSRASVSKILAHKDIPPCVWASSIPFRDW